MNDTPHGTSARGSGGVSLVLGTATRARPSPSWTREVAAGGVLESRYAGQNTKWITPNEPKFPPDKVIWGRTTPMSPDDPFFKRGWIIGGNG